MSLAANAVFDSARYLAESGDEHESGEAEPAPGPRLRRVHGNGERDDREADGAVVLLVEDDPSMQLLCRVNLELSGFTVVAASTGTEAVELAGRAGPFDLVLLDVMLPDLGGFDLADRLRETAATAGVPIVFLSARVSPADMARGRNAGAIDYVSKPFDPRALVERIRDDLDLFRRSGADVVRALRFGDVRET